MDELMTTVIQLLAALLAILGGWFIHWLKAYFATKHGAARSALADSLVSQFCDAAEQLYKSADPTGEKRYQYVQGLLEQAGYQMSDVLRAKIEASVRQINRGNAK